MCQAQSQRLSREVALVRSGSGHSVDEQQISSANTTHTQHKHQPSSSACSNTVPSFHLPAWLDDCVDLIKCSPTCMSTTSGSTLISPHHQAHAATYFLCPH